MDIVNRLLPLGFAWAGMFTVLWWDDYAKATFMVTLAVLLYLVTRVSKSHD